MRYLLYCIFDDTGHQRREPLLGVSGRPVSVIVNNGLGAGVSELADSDIAPHISHIIAYENVIESFHRERAVIPMRYECVFEGETQVIRLLEKNCKLYEALLRDLGDCVEMGVRVLFENEEPTVSQVRLSARRLSSSIRQTSGAAYLAAQRDRYAAKDQISLKQQMILEKIYRSLAGLFTSSKAESSSLARHRLLSLYFLVPRHTLECFRTAFRCIPLDEHARLLLSGPWPPYNFVRSRNVSAEPL